MTEKPNALFGARFTPIPLTDLLFIALLAMSAALPAQGYHEGFDDPDKANEALHGVLILDQTGEWTAHVDGGRYTLENHGDEGSVRYMYVIPGKDTWRDPGERISVEVGGIFRGSDYPAGAGLLFRFDPAERHYMAFIIQNGATYGLYRRDEDGLRMVMGGSHGAIKEARNELGILMRGDDFDLMINGEKVGSYGTSIIQGKGVGLIAVGSGRFEYDNFALPDAETTAPLAVQSGGSKLLSPAPAPAPSASRLSQPEARHLLARLPAGFQDVRHTAAGGQLLVDKGVSRERSARRLIGRAFDRFASYFDRRPMPISAFGDRQDSEAQAMFRASLDGVPIQGLAVAAVGADSTLTALAFDDLDRSVRTVSDMMPSLERLLPQAPGARAPAVQWRKVAIPDGSGTLDLPVGWNIEAAINSMVDIAGPDGSYVNLGINVPVLTPETAMTFWQMPGASQSMLVTARYSDPVTALQEIYPQVNRQMPRYVTRIIEYAPVQWQNGQAAFIHFESQSDQGGAPQESLILVVMMPGYGQWTYYFSMVSAPPELFDQNFPTMLRIWHSWKVSDHVFRERMKGAMDSMREISRIIDQSHADRQASFDRTTADWTEVFRDQTQVRDTQIGDYHEVPLSQLDDIVRRMNEAAGYERYQHLPLRDLQ